MRVFALLTFLAVHTAGVFAAPSTYYWVDWFNGQATNPGYQTTGKITTSTTTVDVTFKSSANIHGIQYGASGDINYYGTSSFVGSIPGTASPYVSAEVANPPPTPDIIRLNAITTVTLTFSKPIVNPVLAIMSTNTNTYVFDSDFQILSMSGQPGVNNGYWGNGLWTRVFDAASGKYKLVTDATRTEPHGTIKLIGTFSTITWSTTASESWHGFTLGVKSTQGEALANTGLGPAQGTVKCTTWGDPHVISFDGQHFDCHIAGRRNYYTTVSQGITTTVDTIHTPLAPPRQHIMVNSDVFVTATGIGEIHAQPNGQVFFTPATGPQVEVTVTPVAANNLWHEITPGFFIIRNPGGVANKFGVYIAAAQMTVYFKRGIYLGSPYWNVDIIAVKLNSDTGLCMDKSLCNTPPGPAPTCPNNTPTPAQIEAACLAAVQTSANPLYTFCVADVSLACDLDVALTYTPPDNPPAPLTPNSPINGDPQFVGLQGQSYQVHGADDTVFALLSTPRMQMNGLFTYIGVGGECNYNDTMCWSHPGTYISQLGFRVAHRDGREDKLHIISGSHSQGLHVMLIGEKQALNSSFYLGNSVRVHIKSHQHIHVHIHDLFIVDIINSDHFFNMAVQLLRRDWLAAGAKRVKLTAKSPANALSVYPQIELHGLLGITWRNVVYPHNRVYEGDVMDYAMESNDMFDTDFQYSQYLV